MSEEEEVSAQDLLKGLKRELKSLKQNSQILSRFIKQEGNTRAKATRVRNAGEAFVKTKESFKKRKFTSSHRNPISKKTFAALSLRRCSKV